MVSLQQTQCPKLFQTMALNLLVSQFWVYFMVVLLQAPYLRQRSFINLVQTSQLINPHLSYNLKRPLRYLQILYVLGMALGCTLESFWVFPLIFVTMKSQTAWYTSDSAIYLLNILCSLLSGIGASLIWIGQGKYISDCATPSSKGFYFGLFWAIYMASLIFGNAISAVILEYYTLKTFYLIMYGFFWAAIILFYNLRKPIKLSTNLVTKETTKQVSITEEVKELFKFMVGKKMLYLLPTVAWTGISIGVYSGLFTPIITESIDGDLEENEKLSKAFTAMIFLGIGEIVGGLVIGQVIDKIGNKLASLISFVSIIVQTVALMLYIETNNYGLLTFVMTFAWGFQDSVKIYQYINIF